MKLSYKLLIILSIVALEASAWDRDKHFQIELGAGPTFLANNIDGLKNWLGGVLYAEGRYAFSYVPVTVGIYVGRNVFDRRFHYRETDDAGMLIMSVRRDVNYWSTNVMLTGDYYIDMSKDVQFFAGGGIGICEIRYSKDAVVEAGRYDLSVADNGTSGTASLMPRIGIVVKNHLRLSVGYMLQEKANSAMFVTVGYAFRF